ncbi:AAA family ATPase [Pseudoduganella violacea]|uniref:NadR type nicotinamide-nucleotide adenylyltransferase n=1 Tax=Pseudoduganella violacea TaxID=1715466 RepID=A0A7W5FVX3_9BURK|nr:ATP-binding protein [Pseudoduganella violacea]MBB3121297.1 NadR type nicotinamide-nucleotide adenylyltransferase [Pseudoduganella violacea]
MKQPFRVAILGSASSGKTTLAAALAEKYGALWVPEYLREFVDVRQRVPVAADQIHIARTQVAREDAAAAQGGRFLFCDTTPLMTSVYSRHYFGGIDAELEALTASHGYDVTLVCAPDIPWVPDGLQRENQDLSGVINGYLNEELARRAIPHTRIHGPLAERLQQVAQLLGQV